MLSTKPSPELTPPTETQSFRSALEIGWQRTGTSASKRRWRPSTGYVRLIVLLFDLVLWFGLFSLNFWLKSTFSSESNPVTLPVISVLLGSSLFAAWLVGGYDRNSDFVSLRFAAEFVVAGAAASFVGAGLAALVASYGASAQVSRFVLLAVPSSFTFAALYFRRFAAPLLCPTSSGSHQVIVVGTPEDSRRLVEAMELTGRLAEVRMVQPAGSATADSLRTMLATGSSPDQTGTSIVLGAGMRQMDSSLASLLVGLHSQAVPVLSWSAFWQQRLRLLDVMDQSPEWLFDRDFRLVQASVYSHVKRLCDVVFSAVALLVVSPILLVTWLAIHMTSKGPGIFRQLRLGFRGREFTIYKFRTMRLGSEIDGTTTSSGDDRITPLGRFLRKTRLDELPQLWNVLTGDMSLVGPRPEWVKCVDDYEHQVPHYHLRHLVRPGITGWAQVNFPYGQDVNDARKKLCFDLYYVKNASLTLDCSIILKTLHVVAGRVGGR